MLLTSIISMGFAAASYISLVIDVILQEILEIYTPS